MAGTVARWRDNRAALAALAIDPREAARRLEVLEHEAAEIAAARLRVGEADELRSRLAAARQGAAIARGGSAIREALDGDAGARAAAGQALREARTLARLDPRFEAIDARLAGVDAEVEDIASEVRGLLDAVDHDAAGRRRSRGAAVRHLLARAPLRRRRGRRARLRRAERRRGRAPAQPRRGAGRAARRTMRGCSRRWRRRRPSWAASGARRRRGCRRRVDEVLRGLGFRPDAFEVAVGRRTGRAG